MAHADLLCTFYGDDLTGSTDAMEALMLNGVPTALFLTPPTPEQLAERFSGLRAVGLAGVSRTMSPSEMDSDLRPALEALRDLGAPLCHYKVCSTFDSSPHVGSIGRAIDIGQAVFGTQLTPTLVAAPSLHRYMAFGNLFAAVDGKPYRLDRHPTMRRHPITPMHEADLRLHLAQQTEKRIGLIDLLQLSSGRSSLDARMVALHQEGIDVVLFDTMSDAHLMEVGRLIWSLTGREPIFAVGSSGVEYALTAWWQQRGLIEPPPPLPAPGAAEQLIVMSGSASPITAAQIEWAMAAGYAGLRLDTVALLNPATQTAELASALREAQAILQSGQSLVLYAAQGPNDPAIAASQEFAQTQGLDAASLGRRLGVLQGELLRGLIEATGLTRVCVTGGDSSGHVARRLGIMALEVLTPIAPGAPLCRATADCPTMNGLQIALKGGQCGDATYFERVRLGSAG